MTPLGPLRLLPQVRATEKGQQKRGRGGVRFIEELNYAQRL